MRFEPILKRILVPSDGTAASLAANEMAAFIAKRLESRVTVFYVISAELAPFGYEYSWPTTRGIGESSEDMARFSELPPPDLIKVYNEMEDSLYRKGEKILADALTFYKQEGIVADQKLATDNDPAVAIMKHAHEEGYDLIVMGQRGDEGEELHLGGTAEKVTRYSEIPVLIVGSTRRISKMLVPFDGSQNAEKALQYAMYLAKKIGATMTLLYIHQSEFISLRTEQSKEIENRILSRASKILDETELDKRVESGDPAKIIIQTARTGKYDLIVMGSKGHGAAERFLLGSVSEHVIHYTPSSVLLVR